MSQTEGGFRPTRMAALWRGLITPSPLALAVALGVMVALAGVILTSTERFVTSPWGSYLARGVGDYPAFVAPKLLRMGPDESDRPLVALVGASVTRSSFGTEAQIAEAVAQSTGVPAEVLILCTGRQSMIEHLAVVERLLSSGRPVEIVLGIGPSRFTHTPDSLAEIIQHPELGIRSGWVNEEAIALGLPPHDPTGIYAIDNSRFLLARLPTFPYNLLRGALRGYVPIERQTEWMGRHIAPDDYVWHSRQVLARFDNYEAAFSLNLAILERLAERVKAAPQARLILVEHAINPAFVRDFLTPELYDAHVARMRAWAKEKDVTYLTLAADAGLAESDFYDWAHVSNPDAYTRLRAMLAASLEFDR